MKKLIICIAIASILIVSCREILFNGDEDTRELFFENFHAVQFSGIYNIVLIQDSTNRLEITGKNNISSIDGIIKDDTLTIDDHKNRYFNPNRNTLYLHFSNLKFIACNDPVNLTNKDTIKADQLAFYAIGEIAEVRLVLKCNYFLALNDANTLGYLHFVGKTDGCLIWDRYGSCMYADSLVCRYAAIYNQSVGDISINATDKLDAFFRGPGNIYYRGNPVINIGERSGTGKLIKLD